MMAALQHPRSGPERRLNGLRAPSRRTARQRTSRPANRGADRKLTSGFFRSAPPTRIWQLPSQVTNMHQESATYVFVFAPGCAVAPNSGATSNGLTTYTGSINYSYGAFVLSHGSFTGQITDGSGQTYNISGNINGVGFQAGYFSGTVPVSFTVASPQNIGSNGVFFTGSAGYGAGPINIIGADGAVFVNGHSGSLSGEAPGINGILAGNSPISTDTNPANPGESLSFKLGIGISIGVQGVTVTNVTPVASPSPGGPGG